MTGQPDRPGGGVRDPDFYRAVLEHSLDLVAVTDAEGRIKYDSAAVRDLLGYEPEEREGRAFFELVHPEDLEFLREKFAATLAEPGAETSAELRLKHADGSWRVVQGVARNLLEQPEIEGILVNIRDVTELRRARSLLDETRGLLHEVVSYAPIVLWRIDAEGVFELSEGRGLEALGLEPGEAVGRSVEDLYGDVPKVLDMMGRTLAGEQFEGRLDVGGRVFEARTHPVWSDDDVVGALGVALDITDWAQDVDRAEFQALLLDHVGQGVIAAEPEGSVIYWNDTAEQLFGWSREEALGEPVWELTDAGPAQGLTDRIMEAAAAGDSWSEETVMRNRDGDEFPAVVSSKPVYDDGELVAVIGVCTDLTEQKQLETQLRQAQKMEAVAQLAGGIAHDFNNLLTSIGGYAALAADRTDDPQVAADLTEIEEATKRARGLADKLLAFGRHGRPRLQPVALNATLQGLVATLKRVVGEHIRLELKVTEQPWRVRVDPSLLEQAILNLVLNARDAMPEGGRLTLATHRVSLDADRARELDADFEAGDYMRLTVTDTGAGIDPEIRTRIFEPFFTTKEVGQGSGLGLSMVFGAVKQAGGGITVESEPGNGTRISLYLRRADVDEQTAFDLPGRDEAHDPPTVLVVEDEPAVLALARRVLDREGYRVLEASSGKVAYRIIERGDPVDLVLTDVIMPGMSGPDLIQRVRAMRPAIRGLFMSGYAADELEARGLNREDERFLSKPFTPDELAAAVRDALDD